MKNRARSVLKSSLLVVALGMASFSAHAICMVSGDYAYGAELDTADHVFVATITQATLDSDAASLQEIATAPNGSSQMPYRINYAFDVLATLKGDPLAVGYLKGVALYDAPDGRDMSVAESIAWQPGDVVLVVAKGPGPVQLSFCGPSKPFDWAVSALREEGRHDLDRFLSVRKQP